MDCSIYTGSVSQQRLGQPCQSLDFPSQSRSFLFLTDRLCRSKTMLPVGLPDALDALGGAGACTCATMYAATAIGHSRRLTRCSTALGLGPATRRGVGCT